MTTGSSKPLASLSNTSTTSSNSTPSTNASSLGQYCDSVSDLESAFHHGFMRTRVKTGEFVYHEQSQLTKELDDYCDVDTMFQPRGPLILFGENGVGKSTFLANWLVRRKKMFQQWQTTSYPEFIFYHVVGCSRQSSFVPSLLERMLREIKDYFELTKEIPDVEERLSWQFPRFLEAASKKGRVILIIDGLQRLRTIDGESILKWVPLQFPPNVRIIFSGTINHFTSSCSGMNLLRSSSSSSSSYSPTKSPPKTQQHQSTNDTAKSVNQMNHQMIERIKLEASRRNWHVLNVLTLNEEEKKSILQKFLTKYHPNRPSSSSSTTTTTHHMTPETNFLSGFQLFDLQQQALLSMKTTSNAQFLKNLLCCLKWAATEGYNIHKVFEAWLCSEGIAQLFEAVLRVMETGYVPEDQATEDAKQFLMENPLNHIQMTHLKRRNTIFFTVQEKTPSSSHQEGGEGGFLPDQEREIPCEVDLRFEEVSSNSIHSTNGGETDQSAETTGASEQRQVFITSLQTDFPSKSNNPTDDATDSSATAASILDSTHTTMYDSIAARVQVARRCIHGLPAYLTGGKKVPGLDRLLGRALSLLYVCRHGLLVNELKYILNAVVTEDDLTKASASPEELELQRKNSFKLKDHIRSTHHNGHQRAALPGEMTAFTEDEWKALLRALKAIGLLFVQEVILMPVCKETLRDVIWWRYIGSEREEQRFHHWLIRFYRMHPTTFRRVEELPWHLKRCYQWEALRDVLVNLPMFQLLYTANFKRELFAYWKTLTDGPLASLDHQHHSPHHGQGQQHQNQQISQLMVPFDVVKEYSRSLEDWYKNARPPTKVFTSMVLLITRYMYDFCLYYQGTLPLFNHAPFDMKKLQNDGFLFVSELPHVQNPNADINTTLVTSALAPSSITAVNTTATHTNGTSGHAVKATNGGSGAASATSTGMCTGTASTIASSTASGDFNTTSVPNPTNLSSVSSSSALHHVSLSSNFFYQRWIWIHFPWLALSREIISREAVAAGLDRGLTKDPQNTAALLGASEYTSRLLQMEQEESGAASAITSSPATGVSAQGDGNTVCLPPHPMSRTLSNLEVRFWDAKKSMFELGHQPNKTLVSPHKIRSIQNSSVFSGSPVTKTQNIISPDNIFRRKSTFAAVKNVLSSAVKSLPAASGPATSIPNTVGAKRSSSTEVEQQAQEAAALINTDAGLLEPLNAPDAVHRNGSYTTVPVAGNAVTTITATTDGAAASATATTSGVAGLPLGAVNGYTRPLSGVARVHLLDHLGGETSLATAFGLPAHFQDYPQSEWDIKRSYNYQVVLKLQQLYDTIKQEVHKKTNHLKSVRQKIKETKKRYDIAMKECQHARVALEEMNQRMAQIDDMLFKVDLQDKKSRRLLKECDIFPPCDVNHLEKVKKELKLLEMKVKDLQEQKKTLGVKKNHLLTQELPLIQQEVTKSKNLLTAVLHKLEKARDKIQHDQSSMDQLFQKRLEMIDTLKKDLTNPSVNMSTMSTKTSDLLEKEIASTAALVTTTTTHSVVAKIALQQCGSMCEKIQKATGFSKLELILEKFITREELNRQFEEQARIYETRLQQIKIHQQELESQLNELEVSNSNTTNTKEDPRLLEETLRQAEVDLARVERIQSNLMTVSKEVIAGASRIVRLMGITNCHEPQKNAIRADQLWPPPVNIEGETNLATDFELLEPKAMAVLLHVCQERACAMMEVIETGRGDPDANLRTNDGIAGIQHTQHQSTGRVSMTKRSIVLASERSPLGFKPTPYFTVPSPENKSNPKRTAGAPGQSGLNGNGDKTVRPPDSPEGESEQNGEKNTAEIITRETIKASSKAKLLQQKKRMVTIHAAAQLLAEQENHEN